MCSDRMLEICPYALKIIFLVYTPHNEKRKKFSRMGSRSHPRKVSLQPQNSLQQRTSKRYAAKESECTLHTRAASIYIATGLQKGRCALPSRAYKDLAADVTKYFFLHQTLSFSIEIFNTTRQSKQCGCSIYIFDNSKSKSMVRLVRTEKMVLSGLVFARKIARMILIQNTQGLMGPLMINMAFMPLYM